MESEYPPRPAEPAVAIEDTSGTLLPAPVEFDAQATPAAPTATPGRAGSSLESEARSPVSLPSTATQPGSHETLSLVGLCALVSSIFLLWHPRI